jgi:hypothetical protein
MSAVSPTREYRDRDGTRYDVLWNGQRQDPPLLSSRTTLPQIRWGD